MKSLKILSLSHNLLRGSMPEGLISKLGATKVQKSIMPGNRLADVDTVSIFPPPRQTFTAKRRILHFSTVVGARTKAASGSNKRERGRTKKLFLHRTQKQIERR